MSLIIGRQNVLEITDEDFYFKDKEFYLLEPEMSNYMGENPSQPLGLSGMEDVYTMRLVLIEKDCLNLNKTLINHSFLDTTIGSVLNFLINKYTNGKNPVIKSPDNKESMDIFIPPMSFTNVIDYLNTTYGIYKSGLRFFTDFNNCFISPIKDPLYDSSVIKTVEIQIMDKTQAEQSLNVSCKVDINNKLVIYRHTREIQPVWNDVSSKEIEGESVIIGYMSDYINGIAETIGGGGIKSAEDRIKKEKFYWNKFKNPFLPNLFGTKLNEKVEVLTLFFEDMDIRWLSINIDYDISHVNTLYASVKGKYRIVNIEYEFKKNSKIFEGRCKVDFVRI